MDAAQLAEAVARTLAPVLPYLLGLAEKVVDGAAEKLGEGGLEKVGELWQRLCGAGPEGEAVERRGRGVVEAPADARALGRLEGALEVLLAGDGELRSWVGKEVAPLLGLSGAQKVQVWGSGVAVVGSPIVAGPGALAAGVVQVHGDLIVLMNFGDGSPTPPEENQYPSLTGDPVSRALACTVTWADDLPADTDGCGSSRLAALIDDFSEGSLAVGPRGKSDFQIGVVSGYYQIRDRWGAPLPNQEPALSVADATSSRRLIRRLGHLARFRLVEILDSPGLAPPVKRVVGIQVERIERTGSARHVQPLTLSAPILRPGQGLRLEIENIFDRRLHFAVLDLRPDWGIAQVFPDSHALTATGYEPGERRVIDLWATLPKGMARGTDLLKIFAATSPLDLSALERSALTDPAPTRRFQACRAVDHPLAHLVSVLAAMPPITQRSRRSELASREWWVFGVEVSVEAGVADSQPQ